LTFSKNRARLKVENKNMKGMLRLDTIRISDPIKAEAYSK